MTKIVIYKTDTGEAIANIKLGEESSVEVVADGYVSTVEDVKEGE